MNLNKESKYFIIDSTKKIEDFFKDKESAEKECNQLNKFYNNRPHNEWGYAMGHHDFEVVEINKDIDFKDFRIGKPVYFRGIMLDEKFISDISYIEALNIYFSQNYESFEMLFALKESEYIF